MYLHDFHGSSPQIDLDRQYLLDNCDILQGYELVMGNISIWWSRLPKRKQTKIIAMATRQVQ